MEAGGHTKLDCHSDVHLNVGGQWYSVDKDVLGSHYRDFKLYQAILSLHGSDVLFVDGDGRMFQHVLNYVTTGELALPPHFNECELLMHDAREIYGIKPLVDKLQSIRTNDSGENRGKRGPSSGHSSSRSLEICLQEIVGRPFLTNIAVLHKYPLLLQNSTIIWLAENDVAFIHSDIDHFRHILNSCHHGVCLIPQDHSGAHAFMEEMERYGITSKVDKAEGFFFKEEDAKSGKETAPSNSEDIAQKCSTSTYAMAIEILQRYSSTQLGRLELSLAKNGKGLVVHGSGELFVQAGQWLGVSGLLLIEEISDFHDMCEAVKHSNIPALVTAVEDFQTSPPFLNPVEQGVESSGLPLYSTKLSGAKEVELLPGQSKAIKCASPSPEVVTVFVGDQTYAISRYLLSKAAKQSRIPDCVYGVLHLRGDGEIFHHILNYFRTGRVMLPTDFVEYDLLLSEANHMGISSLVSKLHQTCLDLKKVNDKGVKATVIARKQKRAKKKRKLCSCPECFSTVSEKAPTLDHFTQVPAHGASIESETAANNQEIVSGKTAPGAQAHIVDNDAHISRNSLTREHSVFIKLGKPEAIRLDTFLQGPSLSIRSRHNCSSNEHQLEFHQGTTSAFQAVPQGRFATEVLSSRIDYRHKPDSSSQDSSSKNNTIQQSKTLMEFKECRLSAASQRLMQMSQTVLEIRASRKTDISSAKRQSHADSINNPINPYTAISYLPDEAQSGSKVAINTDHSYSHPPRKGHKLATNKQSSLKGAMRAKPKPKLVTIIEPNIEAHCHKTSSTTDQNHCGKAENLGYVAVIKHPFVHGQQKDKCTPYKPFSTSRLYVGAQDHPMGKDVLYPLLTHTRQLCVDANKQGKKRDYQVMAGKQTEQTEDVQLDVEGNSMARESVECLDKETSRDSKPSLGAVVEAPLAMAYQTSECVNIVSEGNCSELKHFQAGAKSAKSPAASIQSTPKGSIHLRNLTKLCSQVSWLHSVPQLAEITTHGTLTDINTAEAVPNYSVTDVLEENADKENADPNAEPTGQDSTDVIHAELPQTEPLELGDISVSASPTERQSTQWPLASTPVEQGDAQQSCVLLPLAAKDVVYARMCHRFLLGVIEDSKRLGDLPELTAEVARLVHRLWNADISPSTFVDCLSQLAPFKSHTCEHLTPWIKRSLCPARWYALTMLELVQTNPSACSLTASKITDIL